MWEEIGFIASSTYRKNVFIELNLGMKTPKELSEITKISKQNITRTLRELENKGLIECQNPEFRKGRLFEPTDMGRRIYAIMNVEGSNLSFFVKRLENKIERALKKGEVEYDKYHKLETPLISFFADLYIPKNNKGIVILVRYFRSMSTDLVVRLGFVCGEIKKNYKNVTTLLYFGGDVSKDDERLEKFKDGGYLAEIFSEGEEERLVEFIKSQV